MTASTTISPVTATPILDSGVCPKKVKRKRGGATLFGLTLGLLFAGVLIQSSNFARDARNPAADFTVVFYFLSFVLIIAVHELGHLLGGWSVGFRFSFVSVGPLSLKVEYGKLRVYLRRGMAAGGYAGMHVQRLRRLRRRLFLFTAAGPLANLLSAAATAIVLNYLVPASQNDWLYLFAHIFLQISIIIGLVNLLPFRLGMLYPDGARLAMLMRSRPRSRRWLCISAIGAQIQKGVRPKDWKRTWVRGASAARDGSVDDFSGNWIAYLSANDSKDGSLAATHLERCLSLMNQLGLSTQDLVALEAAVFSAWFRKNPDTAETWLRQVKKLKAIPQLVRIRADVALPCARMEFEKALTQWERGMSFINALPASAIQQRLKEGWLEWQGEIRERQTTTAAFAPEQNSFLQAAPASR
jgi:hypothetical protein